MITDFFETRAFGGGDVGSLVTVIEASLRGGALGDTPGGLGGKMGPACGVVGGGRSLLMAGL